MTGKLISCLKDVPSQAKLKGKAVVISSLIPSTKLKFQVIG